MKSPLLEPCPKFCHFQCGKFPFASEYYKYRMPMMFLPAILSATQCPSQIQGVLRLCQHTVDPVAGFVAEVTYEGGTGQHPQQYAGGAGYPQQQVLG